MQYKIVTHKEEIDPARWSDFVFNHPNGNIFQTPDIYKVYEAAKNHSPHVVACVDVATDEVLGILVSVILKEYSGLMGKLTTRSIIAGGPLCKNDNPAILEALLAAYNKMIKSKAIYSQVRCQHDTSSLKSVFEKQGYRFEEHLNILIDLKKTEEQLWKECNSKRRQKIRGAERDGIAVSEVTNAEDRIQAYKILHQVYKRAKLPFPDFSLFSSAFSVLIPQNKLKVYGAYSENKLVGIRIILLYKKTVYDWYAGSFSEYYNLHPNDVLPWKIFCQSQKNGFEVFDFGGAGKPNQPYPVRDFKKQFGGTFVNFGRYEIIHQPFVFQLAKMGFKLWQKLK